MNNLVLGSSSKFGKMLEHKLPGIYLNRHQFDLLQPNFVQFDNMSVDNLIVLTKGNATTFGQAGIVADSVSKLLDTVQYKTAWVFTSGLGTYGGSKNNLYIHYSTEKMLLNFVCYKKTLTGTILTYYILDTWTLLNRTQPWLTNLFCYWTAHQRRI